MMWNANGWMTKLATLMHLTDGRRDARVPTDFPVYVSGTAGAAQGRCVDLAARGMAVHVADPIEAGTLVFLRIPTHGLLGFAWVRHCRTAEGGHVLGLQFRDKLMREREPMESSWKYAHVTPAAAWDEAEA
jgi:hypothetical protein